MPSRCNKCDSAEHLSKDCKFTGKCSVCERVGHKEKCCYRKKPNANLAETDGYDVYANMICVQEKKILMKKKFSLPLLCYQPPSRGW